MADWDEDSPELEDNLKRVLRKICQDAKDRLPPSVESARQWQADTMRGLRVPDPKFVGAFRGERGLEKAQVRIGDHFGVPALEVSEALARFEQVLQRAVLRLDELIPSGSELSTDQLAAIIKVCAWTHAEWVRIHPFGNGNGRTARLWVNSIAVRYGLPPFAAPRPRPTADYDAAAERAMHGDWEPTEVVLHQLLKQFSLDIDDPPDH